MVGACPWKVSALISAFFEFFLATFLFFHLALASLVFEIAKNILPVAPSCSCYTQRRHHALHSSTDVSSLGSCNDGEKLESSSGSSPGLISRGRAFSEDLSVSGDGVQCVLPRGRAMSSNQARSIGLSSAYRRMVMEEHGEACQKTYFVSDVEFTDDLIEGSVEWIRQQMELGNDEVILNLLKALQADRRNLRNLHQELEEERVAAETAAKEAMAMILRLQEEKSALQMEAAHYQRIAEERALHDDQAIQFLVEDLCKKESEWLFLEEELRSLRQASFADEAVQQENELCLCETSNEVLLLEGVNESVEAEVGEGMEADPPYLEARKVDLLLKGADEASSQGVSQELEGAVSSLDDGNLIHHPMSDIDGVGSVKIESSENIPLECPKSFVLLVNTHMDDVDAVEPVSETVVADPYERAKKPLAASNGEEDDATLLVLQLSAVERQLQALEESKPWSPPEHYPSIYKLAANDRWRTHGNGDDEAARVLSTVLEAGPNLVASQKLFSNTDLSDIANKEKVVTIDVASRSGSLHEDSSAGEGYILEFKGVRCAESKHWDTCEEEKHLDLPSFVPVPRHPDSFTRGTSLTIETCKLEGQSPCMVPSCEEKKWNDKSATLEDIHLRLQVLENESALLRHMSVPSNHEHVSMGLLKEIVQELCELLKARRVPSAVDQAAPVTGGQLKKRHYADGLDVHCD